MPRVQSRQVSGPVSQEGVFGDAVPLNGVEGQAARRAHMREQTMARQAAERRTLPVGLARPAWLAAAREHAVALRGDLARINAEHQTWLRAHGGGAFMGQAPVDPPTPHLRLIRHEVRHVSATGEPFQHLVHLCTKGPVGLIVSDIGQYVPSGEVPPTDGGRLAIVLPRSAAGIVDLGALLDQNDGRFGDVLA